MKRNTFLFGLTAAVCSLLLIGNSFAASLSTTIASGGYSNLVGQAQGRPVKITQIAITAPANNTASIRIHDSPTNSAYYTNASYVSDASYVTNYTTIYTNFFGVVNTNTYNALVHYSITNAATTNLYPVRFTGSTATNTTSVFDGVNYWFINGPWATNTGSGSVTVTVTYQ